MDSIATDVTSVTDPGSVSHGQRSQILLTVESPYQRELPSVVPYALGVV
jgi:hypothetical protein